MMIKAVIFDKDGTLIELGKTWDLPTVKMIKDILADTNLTDLEKDQVAFSMGINKDWTGIKANSIFAAGSILDQAQYIQPYLKQDVQTIEDRMEAAYLKYLSMDNLSATLAPGTVQTLEQLSQDYIIALVTNDSYIFAEKMLKELKIFHYFDFIACADQYGPKPNPSALYELAKRFNIKLSEMIYIGDSSLDMIYAQHTRAGIGYLENEDSHQHLDQADYLIDHMTQLIDIIDKINKEDEGAEECIP